MGTIYGLVLVSSGPAGPAAPPVDKLLVLSSRSWACRGRTSLPEKLHQICTRMGYMEWWQLAKTVSILKIDAFQNIMKFIDTGIFLNDKRNL